MGKSSGGAGNIAKAAVGGGAGSALGTVAMGPMGAMSGGIAGAGALNGGNVNLGPLGGMLGQNGGAGGTGFKGPEAANIQQGTSVQDVQNAQKNVNNSLDSQNKLLAALQGQKGLEQQNMIAQQQQGLNSQLSAANGVGTQNRAISGLGGAANMYQNIANGQGPNPAQAMLNQQTGANVANQAALMAGQRGAGANVGLMARQAAQQGAATQQQAVGQGATMQANQQLGALQGMVGANSAMGGLGTSQLGAQQAQQQAMANQANIVANQQIGQTNANTQAQMGNAGQLQNSLGGYNNAIVSNQNNINAANAGLAQTQMQGQQKIAGGIMGGAGAAMGLAGGGMVHHYAMGDMVAPVAGPISSFGQFINQVNQPTPIANDPGIFSLTEQPEEQKKKKDKSSASGMADPTNSETMAGEAMPMAAGTAMGASGGLASQGGHVKADEPSEKAVKSGNSYDNDKIDAKLSEGEIVLPRSVTMAEDPIAAATEFLKQTLSKRAQPKQNFAGAGKVVAPEKDDNVDPAAEFMAPPNQEPIGTATEQPAVTSPEAPIQPQVESSQPMKPMAPIGAEPPPATDQPLAADRARVPQTPLLADETPDQHYAKEVAFQQDLANRHIEPKTYQSMFADRSTLGKVGTIFGLLLSGAGSGLTGQPNLLMDMMNKEIDRDLDAQKTSKANANTFLKTQYDHDLQEAQMLHMTNQNALTQQQIAASQAEHAGQGQANKAINKQITERAGGKWDESIEKKTATVGSLERAKNKQLSVTAQHLDDITSNDPAANQVVQTVVKPAVDAEIKNNIVKADAKKKLATAGAIKAQAAQVQPTVNNDVIDMKKYHKMLDSGAFNTQKGIPMDSKRDINPADDKDIQAAISAKTANQNNYQDVMDAYNALAEMPNAGQTPIGELSQSLKKIPWIGDSLHAAAGMGVGKIQRPRDKILDALSQRLSANGASAETMEMMKNALAPNMFDSNDTLKQGAGLVYQHFNHNGEKAHPGVLIKYGLDKNIPEIKFDLPAALKQRAGKPVNSPKTTKEEGRKGRLNQFLKKYGEPTLGEESE